MNILETRRGRALSATIIITTYQLSAESNAVKAGLKNENFPF